MLPLDPAGEFQTDAARMAAAPDDVAAVTLSAHIRLPAERRAAFLSDLQSAIQDLLTRHGGAEGEPFRAILAGYPKEEP